MSGYEWRGANDVRYLRARGRPERKISHVFGASIGLLAIVGAYAVSDAATFLRQTGVREAEAHQAVPAVDTSGIAVVPSCDTEAPDASTPGAAPADATGIDAGPAAGLSVIAQLRHRSTYRGGINEEVGAGSPGASSHDDRARHRSDPADGRDGGSGYGLHNADTSSDRIDAYGSDSSSSIDVETILEGRADIETGVGPDAIAEASKAGGLGDVDSLRSTDDGANTSFSATDVVA